MKKGFTMIELIFVIVILGILASVAIPRLAATREDAEISTAVANLRTLVSDLSAYHVVKGEFPTTAKWNEITNVPIKTHNNTKNLAVGQPGYLEVGGDRCIDIEISNKIGSFPAYIKFSRYTANKDKGVCKEVLAAAPIKAYVDSTALNKSLPGAMAIGSSTRVYQSTAPTPTRPRQ